MRRLRLPEVGLESDPFFLPRGVVLRQLRPPAGAVDDGLRGKAFSVCVDRETGVALNPADYNILARVNAGPPGGLEQGCIKIESGNASGRWENRQSSDFAVQENPGRVDLRPGQGRKLPAFAWQRVGHPRFRRIC